MALITGSIPVTGFIAPTDTSDTYAVTDAIYGIDGLRNVADSTERDNISIERRRSGMVVGTINDGKYWRLKNQSWTLGNPSDWELFLQVGASGSIIGNGTKYVIESTDDLTIPLYNQYWIYGDLTIIGTLTNYGEVVIADGGLIMSGGTFSNYGNLTFISLTSSNGQTYSYLDSSTIQFTLTGTTVSAQVITYSLTASHLNTGLNGGATAGYLLSTDINGDFEWILPSGLGIITGVTAGNGLTGGGSLGNIQLDINLDNGLSIDVNNSVVLGGTLSQNTNLDGYHEFLFGDVTPLSKYSIKVGTSSSTLSSLVLSDITLNINDGSSDNTMVVTDNISLKGLVYSDDYTSNFTTYSLVTKGYVDSLGTSSITYAGSGLTESGSTSSKILHLGGELTQNTNLDGFYDFKLGDVTSLSKFTTKVGGFYSSELELTPGFVNVIVGYGFSQSKISLSKGNIISDGSINNSMVIIDDINLKGLVYSDDYTSNFTTHSLVTKGYVYGLISSTIKVPTINDKNLMAVDTFNDGEFSGATISGTPVDNSYVSVFINGLEYLVGNGVTSSTDCYFSNDGGLTARGFSSLHPNGKIQSNDGLYWNGNYLGVNLISGWRISMHYIE